MLACLYACAVHICLVLGACKGQKRGSEPLKTEAQMAEKHIVYAGKQTRSSPDVPNCYLLGWGKLTYAIALLWRSGDNVRGLFLSFHHMGARVLAQVNRCGAMLFTF